MNVANNLASMITTGSSVSSFSASSFGGNALGGNALNGMSFQQFINNAIMATGQGQTLADNALNSGDGQLSNSNSNALADLLFSNDSNITDLFGNGALGKLFENLKGVSEGKDLNSNNEDGAISIDGFNFMDSQQFQSFWEMATQTPFAQTNNNQNTQSLSDMLMPMSAYNMAISNISGIAGISGINNIDNSKLSNSQQLKENVLNSVLGIAQNADMASKMSETLTGNMDKQVSDIIEKAGLSEKFSEFKTNPASIEVLKVAGLETTAERTFDSGKMAVIGMNETGKNVAQFEENLTKSIEATSTTTDSKNEEALGIAESEFSTNGITNSQTNSSVSSTSNDFIQSLDEGITKTDVSSQISQEIIDSIEKNGPKEFKIQLKPEDLGQIDVKLRLNEGKLSIDIIAASNSTQNLLTSQVDKLIASMGLQNVQVESVNVSQQMDSQSQNNSQSFFMGSEMNFSQRKDQQNEQKTFDFTNGSALSNQEFTNEQEDISAILRNNLYRMNYAV